MLSGSSWTTLQSFLPQQCHPKSIKTTLSQKMYLAISLEPWLQFLQTGPSFLKNNKINPVNS